MTAEKGVQPDAGEEADAQNEAGAKSSTQHEVRANAGAMTAAGEKLT